MDLCAPTSNATTPTRRNSLALWRFGSTPKYGKSRHLLELKKYFEHANNKEAAKEAAKG
jgi:hypothetical protein